jgi:thymidylate synthase (FAD)
VKIIEPSFELSSMFGRLTPYMGERMLRFIEKQARISHRSEERQTRTTWCRFIEANVIGHGDWSVTEHATVTATIRTDRGITHEQVRHRLFSFTQESTRFVRHKEEDFEFVYPIEAPEDKFGTWRRTMVVCQEAYKELLKEGWRPEEARSVLPTAFASTIAVTGNLRNWRLFFLMRTTLETHPDFKRITVPLLYEFQKNIPLLYDDIIPNARQIFNLKKAR